MKSSTLSVGEVAERFGLATHVLRHWESVGLLKPARAGALGCEHEDLTQCSHFREAVAQAC